MVSVVIIQKNGVCKNRELKKCIFDELYKKCGFKNDNYFEKRTTWTIVYKKNKLFINLFAKNNGRANTENKFDLPPPVDNDLFFGNMIIVACTKQNNEKNTTNINTEIWNKIYESLMGGFENIENTDDEEEEEEEIPPELMTKHGYKKDGFIVSDDDGDIDADENGVYKETDEEETDEETDDEENGEDVVTDDDQNGDDCEIGEDDDNCISNIKKMSKYSNDEYYFEEAGNLQEETYIEE